MKWKVHCQLFSLCDLTHVMCIHICIKTFNNVAGKTTIIESLKYAVTGSLPPGNKSGQSFVHDPRSIGQTSVKGSIKLRFTNTEGLSMVVARSMEVTQKKTTASFKALDGTIRTVNKETGERVTMCHNCTELDKSVPMVSRVVLSSWAVLFDVVISTFVFNYAPSILSYSTWEFPSPFLNTLCFVTRKTLPGLCRRGPCSRNASTISLIAHVMLRHWKRSRRKGKTTPV